MKKAVKIWLITAAVLVVLGLLMMIGALAAVDFDIKKLSTVEFETNTYKLGEKFDKILIEDNTADIEFVPAEGKEGSVVCREPENVTHSVDVKDGVLTIRSVDDRGVFDRIGLIFESPKVTVCLPAKEYASLEIKNETGRVTIPGDFTFDSAAITGSTGSVKCSAAVKDTLTVKLSTGNIDICDADCGEISLEAVTGDVKLDSVNVKKDINASTTTGNIKLDSVNAEKDVDVTTTTGDVEMTDVIAKGSFQIKTTTGDIDFDGCDAKDLSVTATTGDVKGTLLSEKCFYTQTDTGRVNVPHNASGGLCDVKTNTGDIEISIK